MDYTNSSLVEYTKLSPNNSGKRLHIIDRITPHCVVGQVSIEGLGDWFYPSANQVSSNYGIGYDGRIGMYVEEKNRSWCSSSSENDNRAITIECASDTTEPYAFRDVVYESLVKLCIDICKRYNKKKLLWLKDKDITLSYEPAEDEMILTVHRWFYANKSCPGTWMMNHMDDLAQKVTSALSEETNDNQEHIINDEPKKELTDEQPIKVNGLQAKDLATLSNVEIINTVGPLFTEDQKKTGVLASVSMAQFILESGYCRTELAKAANNCFGMKAIISGNNWPNTGWDGKSVYNMSTDEYRSDGTPYTIWEDFRKYNCIEDSIADHSAYLVGAKKENELRYTGIIGCTNYKKAAQIIKDGGYATAPDYVSVLCQLIEMWGLTKYEYHDDTNETQVEHNNIDKQNAVNESYVQIKENDYKKFLSLFAEITTKINAINDIINNK